MLTSYDQYTAGIFDQAGIPVLLVGDSAANNVYGYETTVPITVDELLPLVRAVVRGHAAGPGRRRPAVRLVRGGPDAGAAHRRPVHEGGRRHAVKLEGGRRVADQIAALTAAGIPVMGHIGFTPQSEHAIGGYRVQGRGDAADEVVADAHAVAEAGRVRGGAGDGAGRRRQADHPRAADPDHRHRRRPRHRRAGAGLAGHGRPAHRARCRGSSSGTPTWRGALTDATRRYADEVRGGQFPAAEHTF